MTRTALVLAFASLLLVPLAQAAPKHSGRIVALDQDRKALTLNEIGIGLPGGKNQAVQQEILLTRDTTIILIVRAEERAGEGGWSGGYIKTPLATTDLKAGDFATVETDTSGGKQTAISVVVVRPADTAR